MHNSLSIRKRVRETIGSQLDNAIQIFLPQGISLPGEEETIVESKKSVMIKRK